LAVTANRFFQLDRLEARANELREFLDEVELMAEEDRYFSWLATTIEPPESKLSKLSNLLTVQQQ
jgi:hypothetical protein